MASQTYSALLGSAYYLDVVLTETNNVDSNTSTIDYAIYFRMTQSGNYYSYNNGNSLYFALGGNVLINTGNVHSINISGAVSHLLASGSWTYSHNSDGTGAFAVVCTFKQTQNTTYNTTISVTHTCTTIPRASTFTTSGSTLGSAVSITITRASSSFTHKVTYTCGSVTGSISTNATTSASWTPAVSLAAQETTATSVSATIWVDTYSGSTKIGSASKTISLAMPASIKPTISNLTYAEGNTADVPAATFSGMYIQSKSKLAVTVTASTSSDQGATIKSASITIDGSTYSGTISHSGTTWTITATTGALKSSGSVTLSATVTDSRGRTATSSKTVTVTAYSAPAINSFTAVRSGSTGTEDESGVYAAVDGSTSYTTLSNKNTYTCTLKYGPSGGTMTTVSISGTTISTVLSGINTDLAYVLTLTVSDRWTTVTATATVPMAFQTMDFLPGGHGVAFGKTAEKEGMEVDMSFFANGYAAVGHGLELYNYYDGIPFIDFHSGASARPNDGTDYDARLAYSADGYLYTSTDLSVPYSNKNYRIGKILSNIGKVIAGTVTTTTITKSTWCTVGTITLPAGIYLLEYDIGISGTGNRITAALMHDSYHTRTSAYCPDANSYNCGGAFSAVLSQQTTIELRVWSSTLTSVGSVSYKAITLFAQ